MNAARIGNNTKNTNSEALSHLGIFSCFFCCLLFFFKLNFFSKNSLRNNIRLSNSLDADQVQHFVRVQTLCKSYQEVTLVGKKLNVTAENIFDVIF